MAFEETVDSFNALATSAAGNDQDFASGNQAVLQLVGDLFWKVACGSDSDEITVEVNHRMSFLPVWGGCGQHAAETLVPKDLAVDLHDGRGFTAVDRVLQ
jgi:hypothetical protein